MRVLASDHGAPLGDIDIVRCVREAGNP